MAQSAATLTTASDTTSPVSADEIDSGDSPSRQSKRADVRRLVKMLKRSKTADARFRERALEGVEFFFDRQWDEEDKRKVEERGQAAIVINRIKPTVRLIHGLMVAQPSDWIAKPVGKDDDGVADVATASLKQVARQNNTKGIRERVYWWALTYGVGWVMAGLFVRNRNPKQEPVQHVLIDPREIRWDPMWKELEPSTCRYFIWSRRVDLEDAQKEYPNYANKLAGMVGEKDANLDGEGQVDRFEGVPALATPPVKDWKSLPDWNQEGKNEADENKQVILHELWERVPTKCTLIQHRDGWTQEIDLTKPEEAQKLLDPGITRFWEAMVPKVFYHVFCGKLLLTSDPSPYHHDELPFIPCWHERDEFGDPVSFVESVKDVQREINHRRSKMLKELTMPNIRVSPGMLDRMQIDRAGFAKMWAKGGGVFVGNEGDIEVLTQEAMAQHQFELMQDAKSEIQAVGGTNDDLMGYDSSSKSGVAKQTQIDQGQTMQRPNESNLRLFDKLLGEQTLQLIQQAHTQEWLIRVTDDNGVDKTLFANQMTRDPVTGQPRVMNDITQARFELEIDDVPWTPTMRQRSADNLQQMAQHEQDPVARRALQQAAIQVADMPDKGKVMDIINAAMQRMMAPPPKQPDPITANIRDLPAVAAQRWMVREGLMDPNAPLDPASMIPVETMAKHAAGLAGQAMGHQQEQAQQAAQAQAEQQQQQQAAQQQAMLAEQAHQHGMQQQDLSHAQGMQMAGADHDAQMIRAQQMAAQRAGVPEGPQQ